MHAASIDGDYQGNMSALVTVYLPLPAAASVICIINLPSSKTSLFLAHLCHISCTFVFYCSSIKQRLFAPCGD